MGVDWGWDLSNGANGAIGAIQWGQWGQWWLDLSYGAIGAYRPHGGHRIVHGPWGLPYHHPTYQPGQHRPMGPIGGKPIGIGPIGTYSTYGTYSIGSIGLHGPYGTYGGQWYGCRQ